MSKPYSNDLRERVVAAVHAGESRRRAAARFGVSASSAIKWVQRAAKTGSVSPSHMGGYRKPVLAPHRDWILSQEQARPNVTVQDLHTQLAARGVCVSYDTVWRFLRSCGLTFKKRRWLPMSAPART